MNYVETALSESDYSEQVKDIFELLRGEVLLVMPPALIATGLIVSLGGFVFEEFVLNLYLGLLLEFLALLAWGLNKRWPLFAAWTLVLGLTGVILIIVHWSHVQIVIWLMILPVGLAGLAIGREIGTIFAALMTLGLLITPYHLLPIARDVQWITILGIWSTIGMIWLMLRPTLTAVGWAWSSYQRNQELLEEAQDYQLQLNETLQKVKAANIQLTRLNQQMRMLRLAAENARRVKEQFVANVSHELRTPLNMIIGFCEMITEYPETYGWGIPQTLLDDLDVILRNGRHLADLINDVLDLSQIESGQLTLHRENTRLQEIVQAAAVAVQPLFTMKNLYLKTEVPDDLPALYCDPLRIREVIINLLSNAGRFTEEGGVTLRAWKEGNDIVVSVADTGPGIAKEDWPKLFEPFRQVDGSFRRRFKGTGLGLTISRNFVDLHGGEMWFESKVGEGATFYFRLPIEPAQPSTKLGWQWDSSAPPDLFETLSQPMPLRIIVIEQGRALQRLLHRYAEDIELIPAADLSEAIHIAAHTPAQLAIINEHSVDATLREIERLSQWPEQLPLVICTVPGMVQAAETLGAVDYLIKPVTRETLLAALDRLEGEIEMILLVESEPDAVTFFRRVLLSSGKNYQVIVASNGAQALDMLPHHRPDVILLDLLMHQMDGLDFLIEKNRHAAWRDIPTIVLSDQAPSSQPTVSKVITLTSKKGFSGQQILRYLITLNQFLSTAQSIYPEQREAPGG